MKTRSVLSRLPLAAILLALITGCDKFWGKLPGRTAKPTMNWYIYNDTEGDLYFQISEEPVQPELIVPGERRNLAYKVVKSEEDFNFYEMANMLTPNSPFCILLEREGPFAKIWRIEEKNLPGKQFYNEAFWDIEFTSNGRIKNWIFHITPEDLE